MPRAHHLPVSSPGHYPLCQGSPTLGPQPIIGPWAFRNQVAEVVGEHSRVPFVQIELCMHACLLLTWNIPSPPPPPVRKAKKVKTVKLALLAWLIHFCEVLVVGQISSKWETKLTSTCLFPVYLFVCSTYLIKRLPPHTQNLMCCTNLRNKAGYSFYLIYQVVVGLGLAKRRPSCILNDCILWPLIRPMRKSQ